MNLDVLKAKFAVVWAEVQEQDLLTPFLKHLEEEYNLFDFEVAQQIVHEEERVRL